MKRNRIILVSLWILSLVGISFYGGPVSYGFFFLITLIPVTAFLYLIYVFIRVRVYQKVIIKDIVAGVPVPYYFTLHNEDYLTFSGIKTEFFSSFSTIGGLEQNLEYELLPKEKLTRETKLICKYRGEYNIGIKRLEYTDYLRLFKIKYKPLETIRVTVRPKIEHLDYIESLENDVLIPRESRLRRDYPDVTVREYTTSDPMKTINWNATAREQKLQVREFIGEEKNGIAVFMDTKRYSEDEKEYLPLENKILETVIAVSLYLAKKNIGTKVYYSNPELRSLDIGDLSRFNEFYGRISDVIFDEKNSLDLICSDKTVDYSKLRTAIFVAGSLSDTMTVLAKRLCDEGIQVIIYYVGIHEESVNIFADRARLKTVFIPSECDLKEVL